MPWVISYYRTTGDQRWSTLETVCRTEQDAREKVCELDATGCRVLGMRPELDGCVPVKAVFPLKRS